MSGSDRNAIPKISEVITAAVTVMGVTKAALLSRSTRQPWSDARHVAVVVARAVTGQSAGAIGAAFGRTGPFVRYAAARIVAEAVDPASLLPGYIAAVTQEAIALATLRQVRPHTPVKAKFAQSPDSVPAAAEVPPALDQINRLRRMQWSDKSIARHLGLPLLAVRQALGLPAYTRDGAEIKAAVEASR